MENKYVDLKLTYENAEVLKRALDIRLNGLRFELARTESHGYRDDLRHQLDHLESITRDLNGVINEKQSA